MKKISNEFINLSKKVKIQDLKLTINDGELTVQEVHFMPVNIFNSIPISRLRARKEVIAKELKYSFEGQLFKTIMQQIEITVKNASEIKGKKVDFKYGILVKNEFEYLDMGEYYIKDVEDNKNKEELIVTGYDKMINFMKPFKQSDLQLTYPCQMKQLVKRMGEVCGAELYSTDFFNSELVVEEDFFTVQELTYRDVLEKVAQATLTTIFIKENKLYLCKIEDSVQELDTSFLSNLVIEEEFGPVNALVLGRGSVEDNIESVNQQSINLNGRCEVRFDENEFFDNEREQIIDSMLQQIDGLEYYSFEASNLGLLWLEPCDVITVKDREGSSYKTIYLKASVTINTGIKGEMEASIPETSTTEYKVTTKEEKKALKVERLAKKNEGLIQDIVEEQTETSNKLSQHEQTINGFKDTVSKVDNLQVGGTNLLKGTNTVTELTASGTWSTGTWRQAGGGTGTRESISVSDAPNANIRTGWHTSSTSGQVLISQDEIPMTVKEEYTLSCYAKGTGSILFQYGNDSIGYTGSNIQIQDPDNWKKYSYTFTSRGTANTYIGSSLPGNDVSFCGMKLEKGNVATDWSPAPEDYSTTTEMNSKIEQTAEKINLEVSKKVGKDEIVSSINQSAEKIEINANKVDISGKKVKFTTKIEGNYKFTQNDLDKIKAYIMDEGTLTSTEKELYDIDKDGLVRATDYMKIRNAVNDNNGIINLSGTFEINPDSVERSIILRDSSGNIITSIGLLGMQTQSFGAERIESTDATIQNLTIEGIFTNNSDKRLKTDIKELDQNYINLIKDIEPVVFTYKKNNQRHIGFIAQDIENAFVKENIEATPIKIDNLGIYSLDYTQLIGILWKDSKNKNLIIDNLTKRIEQLEKEVNK